MPAQERAGQLTAFVAMAGVVSLFASGCAAGSDGAGTGDESIIVGTTDTVSSLDPAGSWENGSFTIMTQVYPFLMNSEPGSPDVVPDIAESAEFTSPVEYTVTLKPDLTFANGHALTSSDVKFSFDRQLTIADPNGPSTLLANLASVAATDETTVTFTLKTPNDQTFAQVLSTATGPIVDEEVFSADSVTSDSVIVDGGAFGGQYAITSYDPNSLVKLEGFDGYRGVLGTAKTSEVILKYYADSANMKLDIQAGNIDVAARSLSATDIDDLSSNDEVKVVTGPGGEIRHIVFNFDTMPFGNTTASPDPAKALAIRQAMANIVDREAIASQVYRNTYTPLYSWVPDGLTGAIAPLKDLYGDGGGGPDVQRAADDLAAAGVPTPIQLNLQYVGDGHYGPSSADEYAIIKSQLEETELFQVQLQSTEWVTYNTERFDDAYPLFQLGWFPDYSDADNYLTPFFSATSSLDNHYDNVAVQQQITAQASQTDPSLRQREIEAIQADVAQDLPTLPLLQGAQYLVTGTGISGAVLDASFKFRVGTLVKG